MDSKIVQLIPARPLTLLMQLTGCIADETTSYINQEGITHMEPAWKENIVQEALNKIIPSLTVGMSSQDTEQTKQTYRNLDCAFLLGKGDGPYSLRTGHLLNDHF